MVLSEGWLQMGLAMSIRGKKIELQGLAATATAREATLPASLPTLILGEILLLIGP